VLQSRSSNEEAVGESSLSKGGVSFSGGTIIFRRRGEKVVTEKVADDEATVGARG